MITISGIAQLQARIQAEGERIANEACDAIQYAGIFCEARAKQRSVVKTGRMRAGNQYQKISRSACRVTNAVSYAIWVELGTHKMAARPFFFPAYLDAKANLRDELAKIPGVRIKSWS